MKTNELLRNTSTERRRVARKHIYDEAKGFDLYDCYKRPSYNKERAWDYCKRLCDAYNGYSLKIVGFMSCAFSVTFRYRCPETGAECIAFITRDYDSAAYV